MHCVSAMYTLWWSGLVSILSSCVLIIIPKKKPGELSMVQELIQT